MHSFPTNWNNTIHRLFHMAASSLTTAHAFAAINRCKIISTSIVLVISTSSIPWYCMHAILLLWSRTECPRAPRTRDALPLFSLQTVEVHLQCICSAVQHVLANSIVHSVIHLHNLVLKRVLQVRSSDACCISATTTHISPKYWGRSMHLYLLPTSTRC